MPLYQEADRPLSCMDEPCCARACGGSGCGLERSHIRPPPSRGQALLGGVGQTAGPVGYADRFFKHSGALQAR